MSFLGTFLYVTSTISHQVSHLISAEPHDWYSVSAKAGLLHSFLSRLPASIPYTSVVLEVPPPSGLFNFLFIRYRSSSYFWENIPKGGRGQRFLLWNISTFHSQLLFSTQESHHGPQNGSELWLKALVNTVWKMNRKYRKGRDSGHTREGNALRISNPRDFRKRKLMFWTGGRGLHPWDLMGSAHSPYLHGCRFLHVSFSLVTER